MTRKKDALNLKGPDLLQLKAAAAFEFMRQNSKALGLGLLAIVLVVLSFIGANAFMESRQEALRQELAKIEKQYEDVLKTFSDQQEALQDELDKAKLAQQKASGDEKASLDKKVADLEAQLATAKPDHSAVKQEFLQFFQDNKNSPAGWVAGIRYASLAIEERNLEEARPVLEEIANQSNDYILLQTQSRLLLIATLEDLERFDEALQHTDQLLNLTQDELKPRLLLTKGRLLVLKEDFEQAQQTFSQIIEQHGNSQEAESAKSMMALLF